MHYGLCESSELKNTPSNCHAREQGTHWEKTRKDDNWMMWALFLSCRGASLALEDDG